MPGVASIAAVAPVAPAAAPAPAATDGDKPAAFHLELGAAKAEAPAAKPDVARDAKAPTDKSGPAAGAADSGPLAWLLALLGLPLSQAPAAALPPGDGMSAVPAAADAPATAARPGNKTIPAVQPPAAAAGPTAATAVPVTVAGDEEDPDSPEAAPPATHNAAPAPPEALPAHAEATPEVLHAATPDAAMANLQSFARAMDAANAAAPAPAATPTPHAALNTTHAEWPQALAEHVQWQLGQEVQEARLELHPRDLGAVQVQVRISGDTAEVRFAASHPQARAALEAALPQLRSLLQHDGIALAQAQVGTQSSWQGPAQQRAQDGQHAASGVASPVADEDIEPQHAAPRVVRIGLVDDFA